MIRPVSAAEHYAFLSFATVLGYMSSQNPLAGWMSSIPHNNLPAIVAVPAGLGFGALCILAVCEEFELETSVPGEVLGVLAATAVYAFAWKLADVSLHAKGNTLSDFKQLHALALGFGIYCTCLTAASFIPRLEKGIKPSPTD